MFPPCHSLKNGRIFRKTVDTGISVFRIALRRKIVTGQRWLEESEKELSQRGSKVHMLSYWLASEIDRCKTMQCFDRCKGKRCVVINLKLQTNVCRSCGSSCSRIIQ